MQQDHLKTRKVAGSIPPAHTTHVWRLRVLAVSACLCSLQVVFQLQLATGVSVDGCLSLCGGHVIDWQRLQGVTMPSAQVSWARLEGKIKG